MIHLDTSFLIRSLDPQYPEAGRLRDWIADGETFQISTVAWGEFLCGPVDDDSLDLVAAVISLFVDFTAGHAEIAADDFARFEEFGLEVLTVSG